MLIRFLFHSYYQLPKASFKPHLYNGQCFVVLNMSYISNRLFFVGLFPMNYTTFWLKTNFQNVIIEKWKLQKRMEIDLGFSFFSLIKSKKLNIFSMYFLLRFNRGTASESIVFMYKFSNRNRRLFFSNKKEERISIYFWKSLHDTRIWLNMSTWNI